MNKTKKNISDWTLQSGLKLHSSIWQPLTPLYKCLNSELSCFLFCEVGPIPGPFNPSGHIGARTSIHILSTKYSARGLHIGGPFSPAQWAQEGPNIRLHDDSGRIVLPRPTKVCGSSEMMKCRYHRLVDYDPCVLVWVLLALSCDGDKLVWQRLPGLDVAVLEHRSCIAKDEVYGACNYEC